MGMLPLLLIAALPITWQRWSPEVFERARAEHRLVILHLGADWCHWCHVMEKVTYQDPEVVKTIGESFIAVHVDADLDPDLAQRYEDYGWPATIVFAPDGSELVKLRGYLPPERMRSMLRAVADDPTPGPSVEAQAEFVAVATSRLSEAQKRSILDRYFGVYDRKFGGWGTVHHYAHPDSLEYALLRARAGDRELRAMAKQTLDANLRLIDPSAGGIYQYSDASKPDDPWGSPHFEKIMEYQASNLRLYSLAYTIFGDPKYRAAADAIERFLVGTLRSPKGAFYASKDADSTRIDRRRFSRENGWAIGALSSYGRTFGDREAIDHARRAAEWIIAHRRRPDGTFAHSSKDPRPHLGDDIAMARGLQDLFEATGEQRWGQLSAETLAAIDRIYKTSTGGYQISPSDEYRQIDENIAVARLAIRSKENAIADHAMRYLTSPSVVSQRRFLIGIVLTQSERESSP